MTVGEYIRNNHVCPYCGTSDYHVSNIGIIDTYKCMSCRRKMWEYEVLFIQEEPISERITQKVAEGIDHVEILMVSKKKYDDLKKKYDDLMEKHLNECRQIAKYDDEIKNLKINMVINEQ